jgi:hypothetical protein
MKSWLIGKTAQKKGSVYVVGEIVDVELSEEVTILHIKVRNNTIVDRLENCVISIKERESQPPSFPR